jgi:hypothetical protein
MKSVGSMSRQHRLSKLEAAAPSNIPGADVGRYCLACLGPGGYRRTIDWIRAALATGERVEAPTTCQRCGQLTFHGAVLAVRAELGLQ